MESGLKRADREKFGVGFKVGEVRLKLDSFLKNSAHLYRSVLL